MEQILITRANSTVELINSASTTTSIISAEHRKAALGEDVIVMTVEMAVDRAFSIGDSIKLFGGNTYKINQLPSIEKISERQFRYELVFEGIQYDLLRVLYRNEDVSSFSTSSEFALTGDIEMFLNVLINNANRTFGANKWALGELPTGTETKNLLFSNENCLSVLQRICTEYSYEFTFTETSTQKILNVKRLGAELDFAFEYGKGKGLYNLKRDSVDSKKIVNKLFVYGSTKNIPANYKNYSQRLHFGTVSPFAESVVSDSASITAFGVCEGSVIFDDVFPTGYNSITGVNASNRLEFADSSMSFDLNAKDGSGNTLYLISGVTAKVHFNSGNLAGYEFEIEKYTHSTKKFILKPVTDEKGLSFPSLTESAFQLAIGDTYSLIDVVMPQSLIDAAESLLQSKGVDYLNENKNPIVKYSVAIDEEYLKSKTSDLNVFNVGDSVVVKDSDFNINTRIKIISFSRNVLFPYRYSIVVSDVPEIGILRSLAIKTSESQRINRHNGFNDPIKFKQDPNSNNQIQSQIDETINRKPSVVIGRDSDNLSLGNAANQTLVEILGRLGIRTSSNFLAEFSTAELTANRVATLPDRNIIVNDYDYIINKPDLGESWETNWLLKNNEPNLFIGNGDDAISVILGKTTSNIIAKGSFRLGSADEGNLIFSVPSLSDDVTVSFPSFAIAVNDWNSLYNKPTSFTPSAHFHEIGDINNLSTALGNKQDKNDILTALTGLTGNGIVRKTGTSNFAIGTNDAITLSGDVAGTGTTSINTTLANSGVTAGTYRSVTVDEKGRVTNGTNPTTVLGYGITDLWDYWTTYWNTTKSAYVSFGASVEIAQNLTVNQDLYVNGVLYDTNLEAGTATQFLRSTNTGFRWTSLTASYITDFSANVLGQVLTGFTAGSNTPLTSSNTVLTAFQNLDARITANANNLSSSVNGTINYIPKFTTANTIGNSSIYDNGYIGIGTNSPSQILHVKSTANAWQILERNSVSNISFLQFTTLSTSDFGVGVIDANSNFAIFNYGTGNSSLKILKSNGNIGVNVDPLAKLHLYTDTGEFPVLRMNSSFGGANYVDINPFIVGVANEGFDIRTNGTSRITIENTNGYVGINNTSPLYRLDINGTGRFTGAVQFDAIPSCAITPTLGNHLVNLSAVQSLVSAGFSVSTPCVLVFNTNQSLSGAKTQGGYTTVINDYALFVAQTTASENGVRKYNGSTWVRPTENDSDSEIRGKGHLITNGTFVGTQWVNNNTSTITVDTTAITYAQWSVGEPIFTAHVAYNITSTKISNWDTAFGWGNHASGGYVKNTGDEPIAGIKTFSSELRGADLRYTGTLKPSGYSPTGEGMALMSASTTTNYWKTLEISDITGLQFAIDAKATTDANLVAISALNTNGFIKRTGVATYAIDATAYVNKAGDTMTGALNLVNSVRVGGTGASDDNTYLGKNTLISRTTGTGNSGLGASSLGSLTTGSNNTGLGRNAGSSLTTGSYNLFLGSNVGSGITTGSNNVFIGGQLTGFSASLSNNIIIADGAGNRRINVSSTGLVGFGLNSPAYRVDVSGDVNVTGAYRINGSIGADHQFLKSNGTTQEWATLNVGEISDISTTYLSLTSAANYALKADAVLYGTFEGERGFKLFHDTAKTDTAALFFANQDTGTVGIHYYGLDSSDAVTQHGIQISGDGFVYHKKLNGSKARFLTTDDSVSGGVFTGGTVSTFLDFQINKAQKFLGANNEIIHQKYAIAVGDWNYIEQTNGKQLITASQDLFLSAGSGFVHIDNVAIDLSNVASLVNQNARFYITSPSPGKYTATLVAA